MIFLHIGRDKTGTTRLQEFIKFNEILLEKSGYRYPLLNMHEIAHHRYSTSIQYIDSNQGDYKSYLKSKLNAYRLKYVNSMNRSHHQIISSEVFGNLNPKTVKKYINEKNTTVLLYLREQSSYIVSAYCQRVIGTDYAKSITEFVDYFMKNVHYPNYVSTWQHEFTHHPVRVRIYDRSILVNNDIRDDFLNMLNPSLDITQFQKCERALIENFGGDLLKVKILLNKGGYTKTNNELMKIIKTLRTIAKNNKEIYRRPEISPNLKKRINTYYLKQNKSLFKNYDIENTNEFKYDLDSNLYRSDYLDVNFDPTILSNEERVLGEIYKESPEIADNLKSLLTGLKRNKL